MNLTGIIRIKEKVAISNDFMPEERDFILDAINAVILLTGGKASHCVFCDLDIELHEDAKGFHHRIKGERIACPRDKS